MKRTNSVWSSVFLMIAFYYNSNSQTTFTGWSYFPFDTGDIWEYWATDGITTDTAQTVNIRDSVSNDAKIYMRQYSRFINPTRYEFYDRYMLDTSNQEVWGPSDAGRQYVRLYRFGAHQGDQWVLYDNGGVGGFRYEMARVKQTYVGTLFNRSTQFIQMQYYLAKDTADTLGLTHYYATLAKGIGLVERVSSDFGFSYFLKGVVINGVLYGDTTRVATSVNDGLVSSVPQSVQLHQNYPNPFNPSTTIRYQLPKASRVSLKVFNTLGQEVAVVVDEEKQAGAYQVRWEAALPSGVYFYRLQAGEYLETKKMILLR